MGEAVAAQLVETGIDGLDRILCGGVQEGRLVLVEGDPGTGKTTLSLQFLLRGVELGETCTLISLAETRGELAGVAASHGWNLDGIDVLEIMPSEAALGADSRYTMYHPSEIELGETMKRVLAHVEEHRPQRLVLDSLSELRLLAESPLRYRRQILGLKQFLARTGCTVLLLDERADAEGADGQVHTLVHGAVRLGVETPEYGGVRRRLEILKMRGAEVRHGFHDYVIRRGGLVVFPRLVAGKSERYAEGGTISSGVASLDALTGGIPRGSATLVLGAAGTGKSTLGMLYAFAAAQRGEPSALFLFDESIATACARARGLGMDVAPLRSAGRLAMQQVDPAELSPGEFAQLVQQQIDECGSRVVVVDSLNGYLNAMTSERFLVLHLHELMTSLAHQGIASFLTMTQHGMPGSSNVTPVDASYLADAVILLRYFELHGEVRKAISVVKNRTSRHETSIRELELRDGVRLGAPLRDVQGVLAGSPVPLALASDA